MNESLKFGISLLSLIPMRREPAEESEMVSQLLFGEHYEIVNQSNGFMQVINRYDNYTGWINADTHHGISESFYNQLNETGSVPVQDSLVMSIERKGYQPTRILAGSSLPGLNAKKNTIEVDGEVFHIRWTFEKFNVRGVESIINTAGHFMNSPYLWGGRSWAGCDCSGFVQMLYKIHGIRIERDTFEQVKQGVLIEKLEEARAGDLAFFADEEERVYHVGLVISPSEIMHSLGYVHIDRLDEKGIFSLAYQEYTHELYCVRRYV